MTTSSTADGTTIVGAGKGFLDLARAKPKSVLVVHYAPVKVALGTRCAPLAIVCSFMLSCSSCLSRRFPFADELNFDEATA